MKKKTVIRGMEAPFWECKECNEKCQKTSEMKQHLLDYHAYFVEG